MKNCKKDKCESCNASLCKVKMICCTICSREKDGLLIEENGDIIVCNNCVYSGELEELMHLENAIESLKEDQERNELSIITIVEKMKEISIRCLEVHNKLLRVKDEGILTVPGINEELRLYEALTEEERHKIVRMEAPGDFVFYSKSLSRFVLGKSGIIFCGLVINTDLNQEALERCIKIFKRNNSEKSKEVELKVDGDYFLPENSNVYIRSRDLLLSVKDTNEGVVVDIYKKKEEDGQPVASTRAFYGEE